MNETGCRLLKEKAKTRSISVGPRPGRAGKDIYAIASVLDHSQLQTTRRYTRHNAESLMGLVNTLNVGRD
ncbi:MAG: hypothetical protein M0018_03475 [Nitrospiraceae bacterium]|nr:hypothetical protein [Nitrospiraceae bacterium]